MKRMFLFLFLLLSVNEAYALDIKSIKSNQEFDRVDIWSGIFYDSNGKMWDISNHYLSQGDIFNLDILLEQKIQNLVITPKIYYDTGFKSNLMHVDELYYISLLINYSFNNNVSFVSKIDPLLRKGGNVTERSCQDNFDRKYHCGTGLSWVDANEHNFIKQFYFPKQFEITIKYSF